MNSPISPLVLAVSAFAINLAEISDLLTALAGVGSILYTGFRAIKDIKKTKQDGSDKEEN